MGFRALSETKRKIFISFHQKDRIHVDQLVKDYGHLFTPKVLGANDNDDFINSTNTDYIMGQIRKRYLEDSSITIVMMGECTHSRRYVDWEVKSSLVRGDGLPNGLIGLVVPNTKVSMQLPNRFVDNWKFGHENCYGRYHWYPQSSAEFSGWINDAIEARTKRAHLIDNSRDLMKYSSKCSVHQVTH